jgi:hypothetical protein
MIYKFCCFIFTNLLVCQLASATPSKVAFNSTYVRFYTPLKNSHALAQAALPYQKTNRNLPYFIKVLNEAPAQKLPQMTLRGGNLVFRSAEKTSTLVPLGGTRFLLDDQRIDVSDDLSKSFVKSSWPLLIEEANAAWQLAIKLVTIVAAVTGAGVCINSTISEYLRKASEEIQAKWVSAPGLLNDFYRQAKNLARPFCPGAAWADSTLAFDYELFFENYCSRVRARSSGPVQTHTFDESIAMVFFGGSDENDRAMIQATFEQRPEFILNCINTPRAMNQPDPVPAGNPASSAQ